MKLVFRFALLVVMSMFFAMGGYAQQTVLKPKFDTYTSCHSKDTKSYANEKQLLTRNQTKRGSQKFESFVQFDLTKKLFRKREQVLKATFRIYETGMGMRETKKFLVAYINENDWDNTLSAAVRAELKLNNNMVSKNIQSFTKKANAPGTWYEVDVTQLVQNTPERYISFRIYNQTGVDDEDALIFSSSENKENGPELVLEF